MKIMQKEYYKCFSLNLKRFIEAHNIKEISQGVHPVTKRKYFIYELNQELSHVLTDWTLRKNKRI